MTKNADIGKGADEELVNQELTIVKWRETHFRALLKHLPCSNGDRAALADLPPILITATGVLVDGAHRLQAYRLEGKTSIPIEVDSTLPELPTIEQVLIRSIELNARYGNRAMMSLCPISSNFVFQKIRRYRIHTHSHT